MAKPTPDATPLATERVDIVHFNGPEGKVVTVCVTVKDDQNLNLFLEATPITDTIHRFVITDVRPSDEYEDVVRVFFRTQTVEEVVALERNAVLASSFMLDEMNHESVSELLSQMFNESETVAEEEIASRVEDLLEEVEEAVRAQERPNLLFSLELSLAEAHLTQVLCAETNAPAFVLTSEEMPAFDEEGDTPELSDFIGLVEYAREDEPEYYESIGMMMYQITGRRQAHMPLGEMNRVMTETLDMIARLSQGDADAVKETFRLWNEGNRLYKHVQDQEHALNRDDARIATIREITKELYLATDPRQVNPLLKGETRPQEVEEVLAQYKEDQEFRKLISDAGLQNTMTGILLDKYGKTGFFLSDEPTVEEVISYYSTPFTNHTYPTEWAAIHNLIQLPLLDEHDWAGGEIPDLADLEKNGYGATMVAMLLTVAARWARLRHIEEQFNLPVHPVELLLKPLSPRGDLQWAWDEGAVLVMKGRPAVMEELLSLNLPASNEELGADPQALLRAAITAVTHKILHVVHGEGFDANMIASSIQGDPITRQFVFDLLTEVEERYAQQEKADSSDNTDEHSGGTCPALLGMFNTFRDQDNYRLAVHSTIAIMQAFTELITLRNTTYEVGSEDWDKYRAAIARQLFSSEEDDD